MMIQRYWISAIRRAYPRQYLSSSSQLAEGKIVSGLVAWHDFVPGNEDSPLAGIHPEIKAKYLGLRFSCIVCFAGLKPEKEEKIGEIKPV